MMKGLSWNKACRKVATDYGVTHNTVMAATTVRLDLAGKAGFEKLLASGELKSFLLAKFANEKSKIDVALGSKPSQN
jgi:hypothetical protein